MLFKKTKPEPNLIEFRKACVVINSCKTYAQLKIAINMQIFITPKIKILPPTNI
jgi:hypothetical protein